MSVASMALSFEECTQLKRLDVLYMKTFKNVCEPSTVESIKCYFIGIFVYSLWIQEKPKSRKIVTKKRKTCKWRDGKGSQPGGIRTSNRKHSLLTQACLAAGRKHHMIVVTSSQFGTDIQGPSWSPGNDGNGYSSRVCSDWHLARHSLGLWS